MSRVCPVWCGSCGPRRSADRGAAAHAAGLARHSGMDRKPHPGYEIPFRVVSSVAAMVVITLVAVVSCGAPGAPSSSPAPSNELLASSTPTTIPTAAPSETPAADARPAWVADLEGQLDCDGPMAQLGQEVAVAEPIDPAPTPELAIENLLRIGEYAWLPAGGFDPPHVAGHWAANRYIVRGALKAIAVSTDEFPDVPGEFGWDIVGLRACDPSEFDPADGLSGAPTTLWLDRDGDLVRADRIFSRQGPGHCGWEGVTFLEFEGRQYLRDVDGVLDYTTDRPFREVERLPADAVDTGLHTAKLRLFTVPDERVVYIRYKDGTIERWGRATDQIGCA
jgi:hypothetical protein